LNLKLISAVSGTADCFPFQIIANTKNSRNRLSLKAQGLMKRICEKNVVKQISRYCLFKKHIRLILLDAKLPTGPALWSDEEVLLKVAPRPGCGGSTCLYLPPYCSP
jgi:hypothetical protein